MVDLEAADLPLAGIRALDLGTFIAGPAAATVMADFGAAVIKVEQPTIGDPYRYLSMLPPLPAAPENYCWLLDGRGKRALALDLKRPEARPIVERLVRWADVIVTNFPPAVRARLRLTYDDLRPLNPRLIYAAVTGYGESGPERDKPGYDATAWWARSGFMDAYARLYGEPPMSFPGMGDHPTAMSLFGAIMMALYRRERTGAGALVTTSLVANGVWSAGCAAQAVLSRAEPWQVPGRASWPNALLNTYRTADGRWLFLVMITEDREWPGLARALGQPGLVSDARFVDTAARRCNAAALIALLDAAFATRPLAEWRDALDAEGVTFGLVAAFEDVPGDPQLRSAGVLVPLDLGDGAERYTVSSPIALAGVEKRPAERAPEIGEHSRAVLRELGLAEAEIDALCAAGVVRATDH